MSDKAEGFYTLKGYQIHDEPVLTTAMEDYLEMICRMEREAQEVRVRDLAQRLHVRPPSVTKMIQQLSKEGYLSAEKYGTIQLTEPGRLAGGYLLYRHEVLLRFLCLLNHTADELEQVEKIEHFLDSVTIRNLEALTVRLSGEAGTP